MNGTLEATPDVRSIPLGAKRKRGRPKISNMGKSPLRKDSVVTPPVDLGVAKTTRKRKRLEDVVDDDLEMATPEDVNEADSLDVEIVTPVEAMVLQRRTLKAGLGSSKPPKKQSRKDAVSDEPSRPQAVKCKKKTGTCAHEVVFGEHFAKKEWEKYAESVRAKKSSTEIDPNYVA